MKSTYPMQESVLHLILFIYIHSLFDLILISDFEFIFIGMFYFIYVCIVFFSHWTKAQAPAIITKLPAKGHTGSLPSTSLDHHIYMLVASRGNLLFTDPI